MSTKRQCPETCPECKGRGEIDLFTKVVPCSQPWAAKGGIVPGSSLNALLGATLPGAVETFKDAFPGIRVLERLSALVLQCQSIVERHGGGMTIEDRGAEGYSVNIELKGEKFWNVSGKTLHKLFTMHQYGAGASKLVEMLIREHRGTKWDRPLRTGTVIARMRGAPNLQSLPRSTNPCAEISEVLCLGGPKHGEFVQYAGNSLFQCYDDREQRPVQDLSPALMRLEDSLMEIHTYEPKPVMIGNRKQTVLVYQGDDLAKHMLFLNKLLGMFKPVPPEHRLSRSTAQFQEQAAALCLDPGVVNCEVNMENHLDTEDPAGPRRPRYQTVTIRMIREIG